jgi:hypothetical protein
VIAVVGQEIAEVIAPIAKWGALVGGGIGLVWLFVRYIEGRGKDRKELEVKDQAQEEERNARESIREKVEALRTRLRARHRRKRLPHD